MNHTNRQVRTTIIYGLICGLFFIPLGMLFDGTSVWPVFFRMAIFTCLGLYSLMMAGWANKKRPSVIFPLIFLAFFVFSRSNPGSFLLLCLGMFSWIRSGICFQNALTRSLAAEIVFSIGGGALVVYFAPYSPTTWGLGIFLFFLVQSLYFVVMNEPDTAEKPINADAFDEARGRAEGILNS